MSKNFLGMYTPGRSVFHRLPVGWMYLAMLALAVPPLISQHPAVTVGFLMLGMCCLAVARVGLAPFRVPWPMIAMLGFLAGYQGFRGAWDAAVVVAGNVLVALFASRLLICTTPGSELLDALVGFLNPLRRVGIDPEKCGLAVGLMIRSIPYLVGCLGDVKDALRARGHRGNPALFLTPVVIRAVRFAHTTGEALAARGLGESTLPDRR